MKGYQKAWIVIHLLGVLTLAWNGMVSRFYFYPMNYMPVVLGVLWGTVTLVSLVFALFALRAGRKDSSQRSGRKSVTSKPLMCKLLILFGTLLFFIGFIVALMRIFPGYRLPFYGYHRIYYFEVLGYLLLMPGVVYACVTILRGISLPRWSFSHLMVPVIFVTLLLGWDTLQSDSTIRYTSYESSQFNNPRPMRRIIDEDNPLFLFNIYGFGLDSVKWLHENLPEDLRPYWAIQFVSYVEHNPSTEEQIIAALEYTDEVGFDVFIQIENCLSDSDIPISYFDNLFDEYESLIGLVVAEFSAANTSFYGMDYQHMRVISEALDVVSAQGAYLMWQDMGYEFRHPFSTAGSHKALFHKIEENADHLLLMDKRNGRSKRQLSTATALGFYLTDNAVAWGPNAESWIWWEAGLGPIGKEPMNITKAHRMWESLYTYPEIMFGIEWMMAAAGGATLYSLEAPFHGIADFWGGNPRFVPAWNEVLLPLSRKIVYGNLIVPKDEMKEKIQVAYLPDRVMPGEFQNDELFQGLYGPEVSSMYEWLPSSGRYYYLPVIPQYANPESYIDFPLIVTTQRYEKEFLANQKVKQEYFNALYPELSQGSAWVVEHKGLWYLANPEENEQVQADFSFSPVESNGVSHITGALSPNGYALIEETSDAIEVYFNNFRTDSDLAIWSVTSDTFNWKNFLHNTMVWFNEVQMDYGEYLERLQDPKVLNTHRTSIFSFEIDPQRVSSVIPEVSVRRGDYTITQSGNTIGVEVFHNGDGTIRIPIN